MTDTTEHRIDWVMSIPFALMHLAPIGIIWTGMSFDTVVLCATLYFVRMFFITAGYHRYFAHRSFKTSRVMQFIFAFGGGTATQKGALWWAGHHRSHHKHSDTELDIHSPKRGFWWSHMGWIMVNTYDETPVDDIRDMARYPELRWLNKHHYVPPLVLGTAVYLLAGAEGFFGGFMLSTVLLYHGTFVINSLSHVWGSRRFATSDTSRNNLFLALITLGEGWHNNHHHYQRSTSQGFYWWEIDISYMILKLMSWVGLVWDLHTPPKRVLSKDRIDAVADAEAEMEAEPVVAAVVDQPL